MNEYKLILGAKEITLKSGITKIGRAPESDILLEDRRVSSEHAQIELYEGKLYLKDLNSRNGTFVDGRRIHDTIELTNDEVIQIATYKFQVKMPKPVEESEGTILDLSQPCPQCADRVSRSYQFCPHCGYNFEEQKEDVGEVVTKDLSEEKITPTPIVPKEIAPPKEIPLSKRDTDEMEKPTIKRIKIDKNKIIKKKPAERPAGFWLRFLAYMLDVIFINIIGLGAVVLQSWLILHFMEYSFFDLFQPSISQSAIYPRLASLNIALFNIIALLYILSGWARRGATWGKRIVGAKIYTNEGKTPIGWGKAILRFIGYFISTLALCIGFIMIGFTEKKRGLHDMIAGTYVVRER